MTDPQKLGPPFDRVVAVLELAAAAAGGHVAYETSVRARKTGDLLELDAALYMPGTSSDEVFPVAVVPGDSPVGVDVVDQAASHRRATDARGAMVVSAAGFERPARKRADDEGVALVLASERDSTGWPSWIATAGFESQQLDWRIRNVSLPPVPGLPKNMQQQRFGPNDALFENPQGRRFTPQELFQRWMKAPPNERALREQLPRDGRHVTRDITLRFDRPMKLMMNTVRPLPPVRWSDFSVEAWMNVQRVPVKLVESPEQELAGNPLCAYASDPIAGENETARLWLWQEPQPDAEEPRLRIEFIREPVAASQPENG